MSDDEKVYVKVPIFSGKKKDWLIYKTKMRSYLAQKGLSDLLTYADDIEKDTTTWTNDEKKTADVKTRIRMRILNRKAAGVLLSSIDTGTKLGQSAFAVVEAYHDEQEGYAGGYFLKSWKALERRYEDRDTVDVADLKQSYYDKKMKEDQMPDLFVDELKYMRKRLANEMNYTMTDKDFCDTI